MIRVKNLKRSGKGAPPSPAEPTPRNLDKPPEAEVKPKPARKVRITTMISPEVARLARNAVYGSTRQLTMSALVEAAIRREVRRLEEERGEPFPEMTGNLPTGRPYQGQELEGHLAS